MGVGCGYGVQLLILQHCLLKYPTKPLAFFNVALHLVIDLDPLCDLHLPLQSVYLLALLLHLLLQIPVLLLYCGDKIALEERLTLLDSSQSGSRLRHVIDYVVFSCCSNCLLMNFDREDLYVPIFSVHFLLHKGQLSAKTHVFLL